MFDISALALKDTFALKVLHPITGEELKDADGKNVIINLYGSASKQYRDAITALQQRQLKRGKKPISAEVAKDESTKLLVACTDSIETLVYEGAAITTDAQIAALYEDERFSWLRAQVDEALGDKSNFLEQ